MTSRPTRTPVRSTPFPPRLPVFCRSMPNLDTSALEIFNFLRQPRLLPIFTKSSRTRNPSQILPRACFLKHVTRNRLQNHKSMLYSLHRLRHARPSTLTPSHSSPMNAAQHYPHVASTDPRAVVDLATLWSNYNLPRAERRSYRLARPRLDVVHRTLPRYGEMILVALDGIHAYCQLPYDAYSLVKLTFSSLIERKRAYPQERPTPSTPNPPTTTRVSTGLDTQRANEIARLREDTSLPANIRKILIASLSS